MKDEVKGGSIITNRIWLKLVMKAEEELQILTNK
jgi:hypothetical protein